MKFLRNIFIYSALFFSSPTIYGFNTPSWVTTGVGYIKKGKDYIAAHDAGKNALETIAQANAQAAAGVELAKAGAQVATAATTVTKVITAVPATVDTIKQTTDLVQQVVALNDATNALNAATDNVQNIAITLQGALETTKDATTTLQKTQELAIVAGKQLTKFDILLGVGAVCTIGTCSYSFYRWSKSWIYPSEEEQLQDETVKEQLEIMKTRKILRAILIKNAYQKRDNTGLPSAGRDVADKLVMLGGENELNEIKRQFHQRYGEQATC
jgi:hypothetical protein